MFERLNDAYGTWNLNETWGWFRKLFCWTTGIEYFFSNRPSALDNSSALFAIYMLLWLKSDIYWKLAFNVALWIVESCTISWLPDFLSHQTEVLNVTTALVTEIIVHIVAFQSKTVIGYAVAVFLPFFLSFFYLFILMVFAWRS